MTQISRNALCPCGSGKKYKKCCATRKSSNNLNLPTGIRMKGGVIFDKELNAYIPIIHSWDNVDCIGEPQEWRSEETFSNEDDAMNYYKVNIRPSLQKLMSKMENDLSKSKSKFIYKKLE